MTCAVQTGSSVNVSVNTAVQTGASSSTSLRTVTYWPALAGMGISQSAFTLAPCTIRSPHIHQRAAGLLYAYDGTQLILRFSMCFASMSLMMMRLEMPIQIQP